MNDYIIDAFTKDGNNLNLEVDNLTVGSISSKNGNFSLSSSGDLIVKSITTESGMGIDFDKIYPVGTIYMSVAATNPSTYFGGTWEQIQDRFLLGCSSTHANGTTGGEEMHALTINEMPSHTHTVSWGGGHSHSANFLEVRSKINGQDSNNVGRPVGSYFDSTGIITTSDGSHTHSIGYTGSGAAHNNMPPYLAVYMWKRVE